MDDPNRPHERPMAGSYPSKPRTETISMLQTDKVSGPRASHHHEVGQFQSQPQFQSDMRDMERHQGKLEKARPGVPPKNPSVAGTHPSATISPDSGYMATGKLSGVQTRGEKVYRDGKTH